MKQGRGNMIVVDITSSALDVHVNNVGSQLYRMGLGIAAACFTGCDNGQGC